MTNWPVGAARFPAALALLLATVANASAQRAVIDDVGSVGPYLDLCVADRLRGQGFSPPREGTLRLSFRRDGTIIGEPFITFSRPARSDPEQQRFLGAMTTAFRECTPLPFSNRLGSAIAGRIFTFHYKLQSTKDQSL